jgi:hypothetical protein
MVIHFVSDFRDPSNERNAFAEASERVRLDQGISSTRPTGEAAECTLDLEI